MSTAQKSAATVQFSEADARAVNAAYQFQFGRTVSRGEQFSDPHNASVQRYEVVRKQLRQLELSDLNLLGFHLYENWLTEQEAAELTRSHYCPAAASHRLSLLFLIMLLFLKLSCLSRLSLTSGTVDRSPHGSIGRQLARTCQTHVARAWG